MKKRMITFALTLVMVLSLAIPAGATTPDSTVVSEELYQEYTNITEQVAQERNISLKICPLSEMTEIRSLDEFETDLQELCDVITAIKSPDFLSVTNSNSTGNPSSGGAGTKNLQVNITKTMNAGTFMWTIYGPAVIVTNGPLPYNFSNATISELSLIRRPSKEYTFRLSGKPTVISKSSSLWQVSQLMEIKKNGTAAGSTYAVARFNLNTNTGVVTMTGKTV